VVFGCRQSATGRHFCSWSSFLSFVELGLLIWEHRVAVLLLLVRAEINRTPFVLLLEPHFSTLHVKHMPTLSLKKLAFFRQDLVTNITSSLQVAFKRAFLRLNLDCYFGMFDCLKLDSTQRLLHLAESGVIIHIYRLQLAAKTLRHFYSQQIDILVSGRDLSVQTLMNFIKIDLVLIVHAF